MRQPLYAAAIAMALFGTNGAATAQTPAPATTRSYVQVVRLKPDMVREWLDL